MNSTRLKSLIQNKDTGVSFEEYRIRYATERFLSRLESSEYKNKMILKGGFLLGIQYNIDQRTTKDLDTLLHDISAERVNVEKMISEILSIDLEDGVIFELVELLDSQEKRIYAGFRAKLKLLFKNENVIINFDLDIGVGDTVTPNPEPLSIPVLFNEKNGEHVSITLYAYPIVTVLAEKTEIILNLGIMNSRMKDFYDMHLILNDDEKPPVKECLEAFTKTWYFRHKQNFDLEIFDDWYFILQEVKEDQRMAKEYWPNYIKDRAYAQDISFENIVEQIEVYIKELQDEFIGSNELLLKKS